MGVKELPVRQRGACCELVIPLESGWAHRTSELLKALADPTRLSMVACLWKAQASVCICDFTATFHLSQPTISHHMAKLRSAGLIEAKKKGIWIYYQLREDISPSTIALLESLLASASKYQSQ